MRAAAHLLALLSLAACASTVSTTDAGADAEPSVDAAAPGGPVAQVAGAGSTTCALRRDGRVRCWTWYAAAAHAPPPITPAEVRGLDDAVEIAVSPNVGGPGCARRAAGGVACWTAMTDVDPTPTASEVALPTPARQIAVASSHRCALDAEGAVYCWGGNQSGQLGTGDFADRDVPTRVAALPPMVELRAGESDTCARAADGSVWCWGRNYAGALGDGGRRHACVSASPEEDCSAAPVRVAGLDAATEISVGLNGGCAVQRAEALCWGWGASGRLGNGANLDQPTPRPVLGLRGVTTVFSGYLDGCAIGAAGALTCWGFDAGDPVEPDGGASVPLPPTPIAAAGRVAGVTGGWYHKCALTAAGRVLCWGPRYDVDATLPPVRRDAPIEITGL